MKKYVKSVVSIDNLREQYGNGIDDDLFETLVRIDPTADFDRNRGGKYAPWILRQHNKGELTTDNYDNLFDALGHFAKSPKYYEHSDLGQYKTVKDFLTDAENVSNRPLTEKELAKQKQRAAHHAGDADKQYIASDGVWELWTPITHAGSMSLGRWGGTQARWCTASESDYYWRYYTTGARAGKLYIFLNTSDPSEKYQLHIESNSWYDINDRSLGMDAFYKFLSDKPVFMDYFNLRNENGLTILRDVVVSIPREIDELIIPEGVVDINENINLFRIKTSSIIFPDSWTAMPEFSLGSSWDSNTSVTYVHLPNSLTAIPESFFRRCSGLVIVDMPPQLQSIGASAFDRCTSLTSLDIPNTVTNIGTNAFYGTEIKDFRCPDGLTSLRHGVAPYQLNTFDFNNVTTVRSQSFYGVNITELINLSHVTKFGAESFTGNKISNIVADDINPNAVVGHGAFRDCKALTGTLTVTDSMALGIDAFAGCTNLTVRWNAADRDYEFDDIGKLICPSTCTALIEANRGYVTIETTEGEVINAEV